MPVILLLVGLNGSGQDAATPGGDLPELEPLPELSPWESFYNVRAGAGYMDNTTLGHFSREGSALTFTELEAVWLRLPFDGHQVNAFVLGQDTRFWEPGMVDKEQYLGAFLQYKRDLGDRWQTGMAAQYLYQDQIFDVSSTELAIHTVKAQAHGLALRPSVRHQAGAYWVETELELQRFLFISPLDDYGSGGSQLTLGREYGNRNDLGVSYQFKQRNYDHRTALTATGLPLPQTSLKFQEHRLEMVWHHHLDADRKWRMTTRVETGFREDNGQSFFDYWRHGLSTQLRYKDRKWRVEGRLGGTVYDFSTQTVSLTDTRARQRQDWSGRLRVERTLVNQWRLFTLYEHTAARGNIAVESYHANAIRLGLDREF